MANFLTIIQARSGSTRLPNKCLKPLRGVALIKRVYDNAFVSCPNPIVAIPYKDKAMIDYLRSEHIPYFEGEKDDVLRRFYDCAITYRATHIGRITADCWCLDQLVVSMMTRAFVESGVDFATNRLKPYSYPEGWDYECMSMRCLDWLNKNAKDEKYREHVTNYIYENPKEFELSKMSMLNFKSKVNLSHLKLSIDTEEDFANAEKMINE